MEGERRLRGCDHFALYFKGNLCMGRKRSSFSQVKTDGKCHTQRRPLPAASGAPTLSALTPLHRSESPATRDGVRNWRDALIHHHRPEQRTEGLWRTQYSCPYHLFPVSPGEQATVEEDKVGPSLVTQDGKRLRSLGQAHLLSGYVEEETTPTHLERRTTDCC